jgi:hypothetical protein
MSWVDEEIAELLWKWERAMTSYIIERGTKSGEGKYEVWESEGFFCGIRNDGTSVYSEDKDEARRFKTYDSATRLCSNYHDLNGRSRVLTDVREPTV